MACYKTAGSVPPWGRSMQELIDQLNQYQPYTGIFAFILAQVFAGCYGPSSPQSNQGRIQQPGRIKSNSY